MKIGILTFHRAENFGAALQCYALQNFLKKEGHEVYIIDYRCKTIELGYQILNPTILFTRRNVLFTLKKYISRIKTYSRRVEKKKIYSEFRENYLNLTEKYDNLSGGLDDYDLIIAGSDQIWRLGLTGNDSSYWLRFPVGSKTKKISYAASSEPTDFVLLNKHKEEVSNALRDFYAISVREDVLKDELSKLTDKPICVVADPTFLLEQNDYRKIMVEPERNQYVFVYYLFDSPEATEVANKIANDTGSEVVEMFATLSNSKEDNNHKSTLSPQEIIGYIANASCVITTSFHGLAMSIIFEKDFWVIQKGANQRLVNLLMKIGLEDRLIRDVTQLTDSKIDYKKVNCLKHEFIQDSMSFLNNCLL